MTADAPNTEAPDLDYAFLAEFSKVEPNGMLTAVGASYTQLNVPRLPVGHALYVAGRFRAKVGAPPLHLAVSFKGPRSDSPSLEMGGDLVTEGARPYGQGRVGLLFSIGTQVPLLSEGLYTVDIELEGKHVRRLAFDVTVASPEE